MRQLPELHLGHPKHDLARIKIAEQAALKLQKQRRMNRITEIQDRVRPGETIKQLAFRHSNATELVQIVRTFRFLVIKQTITFRESVCAQLSLKISNLALVVLRISFARHVLEPNRVLFQSTQAKHPLERYGKIAAT